MDRIREAVTRARNAQSKTGVDAATAAPRLRFGPEVASNIDSIPRVSCDFESFSRRRIISNEQDPVLAAYRVLRTKVLQKMETEGWHTLAIVSPASGAGKTVTAINLAIAVGSKQGSRCTLVDLDFYRPSVSAYLGVKEPPSVVDYFEGAKSVADVIVRPDLPDVLLIGNERVSRRGAEFLTSRRADELVTRCIEEYSSRVVVFDLPPLMGCDDSIAFLPKVDCALLVAASGQTRVNDLKEARRLLGKTPLLGTLLNKARMVNPQSDYYTYRPR